MNKNDLKLQLFKDFILNKNHISSYVTQGRKNEISFLKTIHHVISTTYLIFKYINLIRSIYYIVFVHAKHTKSKHFPGLLFYKIEFKNVYISLIN